MKNNETLTPNLDNLAYRFKFDSRILELEEAKNTSPERIELLKRRLERTRDDILIYVTRNYGMKFDEEYGSETMTSKEETSDGQKQPRESEET